ncbi:hypothetical protein ACEI02_003942 [Vibrio alginolyticus]
MNDYICSLDELKEAIENTVPSADTIGYPAIGLSVSKDTAKELVKAIALYQEPRLHGWPISFVEVCLKEEAPIPECVFQAYSDYMHSLTAECETSELFFTDEAYIVKT